MNSIALLSAGALVIYWCIGIAILHRDTSDSLV